MLRRSRRPVAFLSVMLALCVVLPAAAQGRRRGGARAQSAKPDATAARPQGADSLNNLKFRNLGPSVGGGRVTAVAGIPGDPNTYYAGAGAGGVGETPDGGNSGDVGQISRIVIDPTNPDIVFVAAIGHAWAPNAERGVFRTADGGKTWQKVLFANDTTGVSDLVMVPGNPLVLFAGMWQALRHPWELVSGGPGSGIYRSKDGGLTWDRLKEGLPPGPIGRIALAVGPTNPSHVYALIESKQGMMWDSKDQGDHWAKVSDFHGLSARPFYFSLMHVSPVDDRKGFFSPYLRLRSGDGGKTTTPIDRG